MEQITHAFDVLLGFLLDFGALCMRYVHVAEAFLRARMTDLGWSPNLQTVLLVALTALVVLVLLRVFAPVLRVLLVLFLIILALQFFHPETWRRADAGLACPGACKVVT